MYLGIDIGGTNLKAGLVTEDGRLLAAKKCPLAPNCSADGLVAALGQLALALLAENGVAAGAVEAVGMGVPGAVDNARGRVLFTCNVPMTGLAVAEAFRRYVPAPLYLGNDADCAALGEYHAGAGRGCESLLVVTLGTGVGAGLVLGGRLYTGFSHTAGEVGHIVVEPGGELCSCGRRGCWERYASATALVRAACEAMQHRRDSLLWTLCGWDEAKIDGRTVFAAAEAGDEAALAVCARYVDYLARGVIDLVNILQPEVLVLGGGVGGAPDALLFDPLRERVARENYNAGAHLPCTRIVRAQLGNDAGIIGAALLCRSVG